MTVDTAARAHLLQAFRALHAGPKILVIPNCWDVVSARIFEEAGFEAVATSSAAVANALGYADGNTLDVDLHLATLARIAAALDVPLSADIESGYASDAAGLAAFVKRLAQTGVVGYNLEDVRGGNELYPLDEQRARLRAARAAAPDLFLNARTDVYLAGVGPAEGRLELTLARLRAFVEEGADSVFVPGLADSTAIEAIVEAIPLPLNILAGPQTPNAAQLQELGVRRVSVGSWPMRRTLGVLREIAQELREAGTFGFTREAIVSYGEANALAVRKTSSP